MIKIYKNNIEHNIEKVHTGKGGINKEITIAYKITNGMAIVIFGVEDILSCFGIGFWRNYKGWINKEGWRNNQK